jgi:hypothetical protein
MNTSFLNTFHIHRRDMLLKTVAVFLLSLIALLAGCCHCKVARRAPRVVNSPSGIESLIQSRVGKEIFIRHFSVSNAAALPSKIQEHTITFDPKLEGAAPVLITIVTDSSGTVLNSEALDEIPEWKNAPTACAFVVSLQQAIDIALGSGFPPGIKQWKTEFVFDRGGSHYVWRVSTTFSESQGTNGYRGRGSFLFISPLDGTILRKDDWNVM